MILFSTMRKLQAKGATVYVVSTPAAKIPKGAISNMERDGFDNPQQDMELPGMRDVFADQRAAGRKAAETNAMSVAWKLPLATVTAVPATSLDALTLLPA